MKNIQGALLGILILFSGFISTKIASALTITPIRFEVKGDPGQILPLEMTLINEHKTTETYYSSYANFEAQGDTGSPTFVTATDDIGTWIKTQPSITLGPGEQKVVSFVITIPQDATPGGHFGALFWGTVPDKTEPGKVAIGAKITTLILLTVNGDVKEAGGLTDFKTVNNQFWYNSLPVNFEYHFRNDGGDRVKPSGKIVIRDTIYLPADRIDANPVSGNVLPGSSRKFKIEWLKTPSDTDGNQGQSLVRRFFDRALYQWKNFAVGYYSAHLELVYGTKNIHTEKVVSFVVFPWQLLLCLFVLFAIVYWGGKRMIRNYNRRLIMRVRETIKEEEQEEKLAEEKKEHDEQSVRHKTHTPSEDDAPKQRRVRRI